MRRRSEKVASEVQELREDSPGENAPSLDKEPLLLANSLGDLANRALEAYSPLVESIVKDRSKDVDLIEHTLDGLLGFCFDSRALVLFKKVCAYYYAINPHAVAWHVNSYREMWDSEEGTT